MKFSQDFIELFNFWFIGLLGTEKFRRLLMVEMNLFLRANCVSMSNLLVFPSMFLISSIIVFSLLSIGSENFSPNCITHWTSCGTVVEVKLISQLFLVEVKDDPGMLSLKIDGSILILIFPFTEECGERVGWLSMLELLFSMSFSSPRCKL